MGFPFCMFALYELLKFLLPSIEASSSENGIACKCSDAMKGHFFIVFLDFNFSRLDFPRHKSLLVCKKAEAVVQKCSVIKVSLEISQKSLESTCARDSF